MFCILSVPGPGESRVLNTVGSLDKDLRHGVKTKSSLDVSYLLLHTHTLIIVVLHGEASRDTCE